MACRAGKSVGTLAGLSAVVSGLEVSACDEPALQLLLADARRLQRCVEGLVIRIGVRADTLAGDGRSAPAGETMRGDGAVGSHQARREAARAAAAAAVVGLGDAVSSGKISGEHVDSIARNTAALSDEQRSAIDFSALIKKAAGLTPETFDRAVRRAVEGVTDDHGLGDTKARQAASEFRHWYDQSAGMGRFSGSLDPERYETLTNAIDQHMSALAAACDGTVEKSANLAARALVELVRGGGGGNARTRSPSVTVILDHETMMNGPHPGSVRQTESGHDLAPESIARLLCDAVIRRVTVDQTGIPINVGRKYRTATDAQWTAIKAMYTACAWHGCTAPIGWCQAHHIHEWEHGGPTDLDNLVPLCSQHHHRVHEGRWVIKLLPDRRLEIFKPDGTIHRTVNPPMRC